MMWLWSRKTCQVCLYHAFGHVRDEGWLKLQLLASDPAVPLPSSTPLAKPSYSYDDLAVLPSVLPSPDGVPSPAENPTVAAEVQDIAPPPYDGVSTQPALNGSDALSPPGADPTGSIDGVEVARTSRLKYRKSLRQDSEKIADEYIINLVEGADVASASFE